MLNAKRFGFLSLHTALALVTVLLVAFSAGCGSDEPEQVEFTPKKQGARGESCLARNDCENGLACVRNTCVKNDYPISAVSGSCTLIECTDDAGCCDAALSPYCESLQTDCDDGDSFACDNFENQCACTSECVDNQCRQKEIACQEDFDCGFGQSCDDGECVECSEDSECSNGESCVDNRCEAGCEVDSNCPLFNSCENSECVETGCQTDRECVIFSGSGNATCDEGECVVACENDAECNGQGDAFFEVCEAGRCVFVGCENDSECRAALNIANTDGNFSAVCE